MDERCITRTRALITFKLCGKPSTLKDGTELMSVEAEDARGGPVAKASFWSFEEGGKRLLKVGHIKTVRGARRSGIGTALYEIALEKACAEGRQLVSDDSRSEWAEAFWRKQRAKGRASCVSGKGNSGEFFADPRAMLLDDVSERCKTQFKSGKRVETCIRRELRKAMKGLPKPKKDKDGVETWPCRRFGIKKAVCRGGDLKLDGAVERKARKKK